MKQKVRLFIASFFVFLIPITAFAQTIDPAFDANKIIEDAVFSDIKTFGSADGVQKFLESKGSVLANTSPDFLVKLKEPQATILKQGLEDPESALPRLRTAAELIWDAAQHSGLNPQVILVTLQKEQSLITGHQTSTPEKLQRALDNALGFGCPDATGCGDVFPGFYYQLFGNFDAAGNRYLGAAKSLMKSFSTPGGRGPAIDGAAAKVGQTVNIQNTQGAPYYALPEQPVTIANNATAALYRYTPHVFNGNYNFWKYFNSWFRYANGTLLRLSGDNGLYIIQNGVRQKVTNFVAQSRGLNSGSAITVSPTEIESYQLSQSPYAPADNTIIKMTGSDQPFVFINGVRRPASSFVLAQRGLNVANAITVATEEAIVFGQGDQLTPSDGTVVRGEKDLAVYLVTGGKLQAYSAFTFAQHKVAKKVQIIPDAEIASYPKSGFVAPLDGTIIKSDKNNAVFVMQSGLKRPMTFEVFKNRKVAPKDIAVLSAEEVNSFVTDGFATPADKTYFQVAGTGDFYIFKEGTKHHISAFVAKQKKITPDFTFSKAEADTWNDGVAISPRDNTLLKGDKSQTVYVVLSGQLRPVTGDAFKRRKYSFKNIVTLPQAEIDSYGKGDVLTK
jgi:hypothetical protein